MKEKEIEQLKLEIKKLEIELELEKLRNSSKFFPLAPQPYGQDIQHFHNGQPCHNNPCVWNIVLC